MRAQIDLPPTPIVDEFSRALADAESYFDAQAIVWTASRNIIPVQELIGGRFDDAQSTEEWHILDAEKVNGHFYLRCAKGENTESFSGNNLAYGTVWLLPPARQRLMDWFYVIENHIRLEGIISRFEKIKPSLLSIRSKRLRSEADRLTGLAPFIAKNAKIDNWRVMRPRYQLGTLPLNDVDESLIQQWQKETDDNLFRVRVARAAEICVINWLNTEGYVCEDTASLAVTNRLDDRWHEYDIEARYGGDILRIDVKTAIKSASHLQIFSRPSRSDIEIFGTATLRRSDRIPYHGFDQLPEADIVLLGTTNRGTMRELLEWGSNQAPSIEWINSASIDSHTIPFIFFDFNIFHNPVEYIKLQNFARDLSTSFPNLAKEIFCPALALYYNLKISSLRPVSESEILAYQISAWFVDRIGSGRPRLSQIYLLICQHFVVHHKTEIAGDLPAIYRRLIRTKFSNQIICSDPCDLLDTLIYAFESILKEGALIPPFSGFRITEKMTVLAILHRPLSHHSERAKALTIVAHCSKCREYPLVYGKNRTCEICGALICSNGHGRPFSNCC